MIVHSADPNPADDGLAGTPSFPEPPFRAEDIVVHTVGLRGRFRVERCFPMICGRWGVQMVEVGGPHAGTMFASSARALRLATQEESQVEPQTWEAYEMRRTGVAIERGHDWRAATLDAIANQPLDPLAARIARAYSPLDCLPALLRTRGLMLEPPTW